MCLVVFTVKELSTEIIANVTDLDSLDVFPVICRVAFLLCAFRSEEKKKVRNTNTTNLTGRDGFSRRHSHQLVILTLCFLSSRHFVGRCLSRLQLAWHRHPPV